MTTNEHFVQGVLRLRIAPAFVPQTGLQRTGRFWQLAKYSAVQRVAVGALVAQRPPHRSVLVELPHTALALGK